jgi:hypothetical protein
MDQSIYLKSPIVRAKDAVNCRFLDENSDVCVIQLTGYYVPTCSDKLLSPIALSWAYIRATMTLNYVRPLLNHTLMVFQVIKQDSQSSQEYGFLYIILLLHLALTVAFVLFIVLQFPHVRLRPLLI